MSTESFKAPPEKAGGMYSHPPFSRDQFSDCYRAYAAALLAIQHSNGLEHQLQPDDGDCLEIARRIIEASAYGERDAERLKLAGIDGFAGQARSI